MNKLFSYALLISLWLTSSCAAISNGNNVPPPIYDGQINTLFPGSVKYGLWRVSQGLSGAEVLQSPNGKNIMVSWASDKYPGVRYFWNYGNKSDITRCYGNAACTDTYNELVTALKNLGWRVLSKPEYKPIVVGILSIIAKASEGLTTPVFVIMPDEFNANDVFQNEPVMQ
jgi:hypothetical protein